MNNEYDFSNATRGPVLPPSRGKQRITIRIDEDILVWFRASVHAAGGGNYQTRINDALREHMAREDPGLEATLRRVVREELDRHEIA